MSTCSFYRTHKWVTVAVMLTAGLAAHPVLGQQEFRGTWADIWHVGYKSQAQIDDMVARAVQGGYNAVLAEVLGYHDASGSAHGAYWNSSIVPKAPDISPPSLDPLAYLCQRAHAFGIEVHAWLIPYRVSAAWPPAGNAILTAHPEWIMCTSDKAYVGGGPFMVDGVYVLDPGSPDVQEYLISIVRELVTNYPIDGINWDYIRYTQTDGGYAWNAAYANSGLKRFQRIYSRSDIPAVGDSTWSDFRRRTIDELVRRCRVEIPLITSNPRQPVRHTADVLATGNAPVSFTSSSAYNYFQNWRYWMEMGWLDATIPMNYKREHCTTEAAWFRNWVVASNNWRYQRHTFNGQATYLNSFDNSLAQMQYIRSAGANGMVSYSYYGSRATEIICDDSDPWTNDWTWYAFTAANIFNWAASTPQMPWRNPATATEGTLWGRITDAATGQPVDNALVQVTGRTDQETDANGYYAITLIPASAEGTPTSVSISRVRPATPAYDPINHPAAYVLAGDLSRYDFALGASPPLVGLNGQPGPITLTRSVAYGESLPNETFTVSALETPTRGPVNYMILSDKAWLSAGPRRGISYGESDTITITYQIASLPRGRYTGVLTVSDALAANHPMTVTVNLAITPIPVPGDFDDDNDVDQEDFGRMQICLSGSTVPQNLAECQAARLDGDTDVDPDDMRLFIGCMTGPGQIGDIDCLIQ